MHNCKTVMEPEVLQHIFETQATRTHAGPVHGLCRASAWLMQGLCVVHAWPVRGMHSLCVSRAWCMHGLRVVHAWPVHGLCMAWWVHIFEPQTKCSRVRVLHGQGTLQRFVPVLTPRIYPCRSRASTGRASSSRPVSPPSAP